VIQRLGRVHDASSVPHWYLPFVGVDPARQGLGLGSLLLRAGLSRVDQDGVECDLITMPPRTKTMVAYAGTIKVEGTRVLHNVDISWNENWTGSASSGEAGFVRQPPPGREDV
jgi:GNAT superfamily N-acetyltransferase